MLQPIVNRRLGYALALIGVLATTPAMAQQVQAGQSDISFVNKEMGVPVEGHFRKFDAQLHFDPAKPESSSVAFKIDLASATVGSKETDSELVKPEWFDTAKFPQATFQSTSIKKKASGAYDVSGKLSIKGVSQDVVVPVTLTQNGANTVANGSFAIKRLSFKIGAGEWSDTSTVADDVVVRFKLALTGVGKL